MCPPEANFTETDPTCLAEWLRRRALRSPEQPALTFAGETLSYGQLQTHIEQLATALVAGGLKPGDRVGFVGLNHAVTLIALFATARAAAIFVPVNFRLAPAELAVIINDAGIHSLIADTAHAAVIDGIRSQLPCRRYLHTDNGPANWEPIDSLLQTTDDIMPALTPSTGDTALLLYTSGTQGQPKGVMLTHGNIWASNMNSLLVNEFNSRDVTVNCAPLFHAAGLCVATLPALLAGGHLVLQPGFEPEGFLRALEQQHATVSLMVPAMMLFASQHPNFADANLTSMRLVVAGGAPVPEPLLRLYRERGIPVSQAYGMTESASVVTALEPERALSRLGSCGRACPLTEIMLANPHRQPITQPGVPGELWLRGHNIAVGYWNRPEQSAAAFDDQGWYHSGDAAYVDDEGFYFICDRMKDMIISGGENIYPAEVENVLYDHPDIAEVAVVGAPDPRWGEQVVAVIVCRDNSCVTLEALTAFAAPRLARYKLPKAIQQVASLPRNSMGKVLKSVIREGLIGGG